MIASERTNLLASIEKFASAFLADLRRRNTKSGHFWYYMEFCSPMVFNLIAWELIHAKDLENMPSLKQLIIEAATAAQSTISCNGSRDPEISGQGRRTFNEISEAELAANILPRLEQILHIWGISWDADTGKIIQHKLTGAEEQRLTTYYGAS